MKIKKLIAVSILILGLASCKSKENDENADGVITEQYAPFFMQLQEINDSIRQCHVQDSIMNCNVCDSVSTPEQQFAEAKDRDKESDNNGSNIGIFFGLAKSIFSSMFNGQGIKDLRELAVRGDQGPIKANKAVADSVINLYLGALNDFNDDINYDDIDNLTKRYLSVIMNSDVLTAGDKTTLYTVVTVGRGSANFAIEQEEKNRE